MKRPIDTDLFPEWQPFVDAVQQRRPDAGTWCEAWTVRDIVAHQAGNAEELARVLGGHLAGEPVGTLFLATGQTHAARKRWIGLTARPKGHFIVDAGARRALEVGSKSLLAIGVVDVVGDFEKGDVVGILDPERIEFARGLTNYATADAKLIRGMRTEQARKALGSTPYDEVVHKDNLVLTL